MHCYHHWMILYIIRQMNIRSRTSFLQLTMQVSIGKSSKDWLISWKEVMHILIIIPIMYGWRKPESRVPMPVSLYPNVRMIRVNDGICRIYWATALHWKRIIALIWWQDMKWWATVRTRWLPRPNITQWTLRQVRYWLCGIMVNHNLHTLLLESPLVQHLTSVVWIMLSKTGICSRLQLVLMERMCLLPKTVGDFFRVWHWHGVFPKKNLWSRRKTGLIIWNFVWVTDRWVMRV